MRKKKEVEEKKVIAVIMPLSYFKRFGLQAFDRFDSRFCELVCISNSSQTLGRRFDEYTLGPGYYLIPNWRGLEAAVKHNTRK